LQGNGANSTHCADPHWFSSHQAAGLLLIFINNLLVSHTQAPAGRSGTCKSACAQRHGTKLSCAQLPLLLYFAGLTTPPPGASQHSA
jgi:hypothetical protein